MSERDLSRPDDRPRQMKRKLGPASEPDRVHIPELRNLVREELDTPPLQTLSNDFRPNIVVVAVCDSEPLCQRSHLRRERRDGDDVRLSLHPRIDRRPMLGRHRDEQLRNLRAELANREVRDDLPLREFGDIAPDQFGREGDGLTIHLPRCPQQDFIIPSGGHDTPRDETLVASPFGDDEFVPPLPYLVTEGGEGPGELLHRDRPLVRVVIEELFETRAAVHDVPSIFLHPLDWRMGL